MGFAYMLIACCVVIRTETQRRRDHDLEQIQLLRAEGDKVRATADLILQKVFPRSSRQVASFSSVLLRAILTSYDALRSSRSFWWASITESFVSTSSAWSFSSSAEGWDMESS